MLRRELVKRRSKKVVRVEIVGTGVDVWVGDEGHRWVTRTEKQAVSLFWRKLNGFLRQGYRETGRSLSRREFLLDDGRARKFWNIELDGATHTVRFGRAGSAGQTQTKTFATKEAAEKSYEKLIAGKIRQGYEEIDSRRHK